MRTIILAAVLSSLCSIGLAGAAKPGALPRSTPEKQGIPSAAILEFVEAADQQDTMNSCNK